MLNFLTLHKIRCLWCQLLEHYYIPFVMTSVFDVSCSLSFWTSRHIKFSLVAYTWNILFSGGVIIWPFCLSVFGYTYFTLFAPSCGRILNFLWFACSYNSPGWLLENSFLLFLRMWQCSWLLRFLSGPLPLVCSLSIIPPLLDLCRHCTQTHARTGSWPQNGKGCEFSSRV